MSNDIFYVYPQDGHDKYGAIFDKTKSIAAKFLVVNGANVIDPNPGGSAGIHLYRKLDSSGKIDERSIFTNPHNYLIVPAHYNPSEAAQFAGTVNMDVAEAGAVAGLGAMTRAFVPGGSQDLQRGEEWGVPKGEISPAFRDAASWNLGYITQMTLLPNDAAVVGGAAVNVGGYTKELIVQQFKERSLHQKKPPGPTQRLDGPLGMSEVDYQAFLAGVESGEISEKDGALGIYRWLRDRVRSGATNAGRTLHDLALELGKHGIGGFAPIGRMAPPPAKTAPRPWHTGGQAVLRAVKQATEDTMQAGAGTKEAGATGYKAVLAQAKALATQQRQQRLAAGWAAAMGITPSALDSISFAPIGARLAHQDTKLPSRLSVDASAAVRAQAGPSDLAPAFVPARQAGLASHLASTGRGGDSVGDEEPVTAVPASETRISQADLGYALDDYFFQQSRLPPRGGAAFNPMLSPLWAGLKIPGMMG